MQLGADRRTAPLRDVGVLSSAARFPDVLFGLAMLQQVFEGLVGRGDDRPRA
jgi:hypothetical protein